MIGPLPSMTKQLSTSVKNQQYQANSTKMAADDCLAKVLSGLGHLTPEKKL